MSIDEMRAAHRRRIAEREARDAVERERVAEGARVREAGDAQLRRALGIRPKPTADEMKLRAAEFTSRSATERDRLRERATFRRELNGLIAEAQRLEDDAVWSLDLERFLGARARRVGLVEFANRLDAFGRSR